MKVVFLKKNNFLEYSISSLEGYVFNPKNKNIEYLNIVNKEFIKHILSKKINRDVYRVKRAIKLIVSSDATFESDCDIMLDEIFKITKKLEKKYRIYFDEFEYFENVKELYMLNQLIKYKKKIVSMVE